MTGFVSKGRKSAPFPTPALGLLVALLACSDAPAWTGTVETLGDVEVISNPGDPLLAEASGLASELWTVNGSNWVAPTRVHVASGIVYVVDPRANQLHRVSLEGAVQTSLGKTGEGPGEFRGLLDAFRYGDELVVIDGGKGSVEYLDLEGGYRSSLHIDGQAWGGFPLEDGTLLVKGEFLSDPRAETRGDWVRVLEGSEPEAFTLLTLDPLPEEEGVRCSDFSSWWGGAARLRFTTPQIQVFDPAGRLSMESRIDLPIEVITDAEREAALENMRERLSGRGFPPPFIEQSLAVSEERWKVKCRFGPLRFDPSGVVAAFLEQNPDEFGAGNATLHLLSRAGVYLARVAFPTPWTDFTLDDGVVYALVRDPVTDLIALRAFRVDLPEFLLGEAAGVLEDARQAERG